MKFLNLICFICVTASLNAQTLLSKKVSLCDETGEVYLKINRVYSKEIVRDTFILKFSFMANCCAGHDLKIEKRSDSLFLNQNVAFGLDSIKRYVGGDTIWELTEVECMCNCYFFETLRISGISDTATLVFFNGRELPVSKSMHIKFPDEYVLEKKTPKNQLNEFAQPVGLWEERYPHSRKVHYQIYYDPDAGEKSKVLWSKSFDKEGNITEVVINAARGNYEFNFDFDSDGYSRLLRESQQCWPDEK